MKILVIEDEEQLCNTLRTLLAGKGYFVDTAYDGAAGEDMAMTGIYDVIVLDVMLPKKSGFEVLKSLRGEMISTPVLLLTAKAEVEDKVAGLDYGADDYLTKPFETAELLARIRAMTRRRGEYAGDDIRFGNTTLDRNTHEISHGGRRVKLGTKEFQVLEMLMTNSRQIIPKERFIEKIWGYDSDAEYNAIEVYVSFIRRKLAAVQADFEIKAVRGAGYSLEEKEIVSHP